MLSRWRTSILGRFVTRPSMLFHAFLSLRPGSFTWVKFPLVPPWLWKGFPFPSLLGNPVNLVGISFGVHLARTLSQLGVSHLLGSCPRAFEELPSPYLPIVWLVWDSPCLLPDKSLVWASRGYCWAASGLFGTTSDFPVLVLSCPWQHRHSL